MGISIHIINPKCPNRCRRITPEPLNLHSCQWCHGKAHVKDCVIEQVSWPKMFRSPHSSPKSILGLWASDLTVYCYLTEYFEKVKNAFSGIVIIFCFKDLSGWAGSDAVAPTIPLIGQGLLETCFWIPMRAKTILYFCLFSANRGIGRAQQFSKPYGGLDPIAHHQMVFYGELWHWEFYSLL